MEFTASEIYSNSASSVAKLIALRGSNPVGFGSGFVVNGKLVTCAHVVKNLGNCKLKVSFDKPANNCDQEWLYETGLRFLGCSDEQSYDYAILDVPNATRVGPSIQFTDRMPNPGEPVCALGYPFEDTQLTIHQGIISSIYKSGVATMLKLDMSINPSNSGGPLISMIDGKVVGIVARKATGLSESFDDLIQTFACNANYLQNSGMRMGGGGIDAIDVLAKTQLQMKGVAEQIKRSANVGIGYAFWIDPLKSEGHLNNVAYPV